jgi:HAMP domain-containing protein/HPt (histidine-containing phosphotransfer) domain-containing protein
MRLRLATKIVLALVAVLATLLLVINLASYRHTRGLVADVKRGQLEAEFRRFEQQLADIAIAREQAGLAAARLGEWIYRQRLAGAPIDVKQASEAACASVLEAQSAAVLGVGLWFEPHALGPDLEWVGPYANRGAGGAIGITWEYANDGYDYPNQAWYTKLIAKDWPRTQRLPTSLTTTEPYLDKIDGVPTVFQTTGYAMHGPDGRVIGMATVDSTLTTVQSLLGQFQITPSSSAFFLDPSGLVLYPVARTDALSKVDSLPYHRALHVDDLVVGQLARASGVEAGAHVADIVYARIHGGAVLGVVLATDEAYAVLGTVATQSLVYGLIAIVAAALAIAMLVRRQLRPLAGVTGAAQRVAGGDLDVRMEASSRDEIGELASAFSHMVGEVKQRDAALRDHAQNLEGQVAERTRSIQLILDSTGEALVPTSLDGTVGGSLSQAALAWFGAPVPGTRIWDYLFAPGSAEAVGFELGFGQLADDFLPFELLCAQMPQRIERAGRVLALDYRRVAGDGSLLIVAADVTARVASEQREQELRETAAILSNYMRDRQGFRQSLDECAALVDRVQGGEAVSRKRDLHTLKGSSAILGFLRFAQVCHGLEDRLADGEADDAAFAALRPAFEQQLASIEHIVDRKDDVVELTSHDYDTLVERVRARADYPVLLAMLRAARQQPVAAHLTQLQAQARRLGDQVGKPVEVRVTADDLRLPPGAGRELFTSLVHVIRNAIDHGLEAPERRAAIGKPAIGTVTLGATREGDALCITVGDDGAGIDWDRLRAKAEGMGLPSDSRGALEAALFTDGVSTRDEVTELSGRGVGLAAVRAGVLAAGGSIEVRTVPGNGTTFRFLMPLHALGWRAASDVDAAMPARARRPTA